MQFDPEYFTAVTILSRIIPKTLLLLKTTVTSNKNDVRTEIIFYSLLPHKVWKSIQNNKN